MLRTFASVASRQRWRRGDLAAQRTLFIIFKAFSSVSFQLQVPASASLCSTDGGGKREAYLSTEQQLNQLVLRLVGEFALLFVACRFAFDRDADLALDLLCCLARAHTATQSAYLNI